MAIQINEILKKLLLPRAESWNIDNVEVNETAEEIHVFLTYDRGVVVDKGIEYPIYDFRHERIWRHLDLWQYKTFIHAAIPRYRNSCGNIVSIEVPWAGATDRISELLKKKR